MREFVTKSKKLKVTINGTSYEMRCPSLGEQEKLDEKTKSASPGSVPLVYKEFFQGLGLPIEAMDQMDSDDFIDFIKFVFSPNVNGPQSQP